MAGAPFTHREWFEKAYASASEWTRFADPKALGVLVLLGLGLSDVLTRAKVLSQAADEHAGAWATVATISFWISAVLAVATVVTVSRALFPNVTPKKSSAPSLLYFGTVSSFKTGSEYADEVRAKTPQQLEDDLADQAWQVATVATLKHNRTRWAYWCVLAFLVAWAAGRLALSLI